MISRRSFIWSTGTTACTALACRRLLAEVDASSLERAAGVLRKATSTQQVSAAALYVRQGEQEFAQSFGLAPDRDAIFLLASISKPISIAAVMSLHDEGEVRLDDRVQKYIPQFRGDGRDDITVRQLMTHVSGLPDQLPQNAKLRARNAPLSQFIQGAIHTPLLFKPGTRYSYSSMAILLATEIAQRITGQPISQLVRDRVTKPLGMKHSALGVGTFALDSLMKCQVKNAAPESGAGAANTKSWDWNSKYWRELGVPWGGAHGSAPDVAKFLDAFLHPTGQWLKRETTREMISNQNSEGLRPRGLGFDLGAGLGGPARNDVFGHSGSTGTLCWADPRSETICVILTTLPAGAASPHPRTLTTREVAQGV